MKHLYKTWAAACLVAGSALAATAADAPKESIVFRYDGSLEYGVCYRIPAITTVEAGEHKGRIIAVNDYRYGGGDIGAGRIDLYQSISDDNGTTWSAPDHFRDSESNPVAQGNYSTDSDCAFGDAAIVSDRETGRLMMVAVGGHVNFFAGRRHAPNFCDIWYSEDGGDSWSARRDITEDILSLFDGEPAFGLIDAFFFGSGRMVQSRQIKVGKYYRIYAALSSQNGGNNNNTRNWALYTDDMGETWHILGQMPCVAYLGDEPKLEELPDGSVLLAARGKSGNRNFNIFRYTGIADGTGVWDNPVNTDLGLGFTINACNGEIMLLPVVENATGNKCYLALQSHVGAPSRINVTLSWKPLAAPEDIYSPEAFTTWEGRYQVSKMGSGYSTMSWQHDNTLAFFYEESRYGKDYCGVYRNLTIDEITDGKYSYSDDTDGAVRLELAKALVEHRIATEITGETEGKYVGQPNGTGSEQSRAAADKWIAEPTPDNYAALNKALIAEGRITPTHATIYRISNTMWKEDEPKYLAASADGLTLSDTPTAATEFSLLRVSLDRWFLYNHAQKLYVGKTPTFSATTFPMTEESKTAGRYILTSDLDGKTTLVCSAPGTFFCPAISVNDKDEVLCGAESNDGSKWYLEPIGIDDNPPAFGITGVEMITNGEAQGQAFDLRGIPAAEMKQGQLYVVPGKGVIIR